MTERAKRGTLSDGEIARAMEEAVAHQRANLTTRARAHRDPACFPGYGDIEEEILVDDDEPVMHTDLPSGGCPDRIATLAQHALEGRGDGGQAADVHRCSETHQRQQEAAEVSLRDLPSHLDPHDLSQTGWGVITAAHRRTDLLDAIEPLLRYRKQAAPRLYRDDVVFAQGTSVETFLWENLGTSPGVIDPETLPYYLLIVGGPDEVPYALQYALSINRAVGRIAFDDLAGYRRYADSVVAAEAHGTDRPHEVRVLSVEGHDLATRLLAQHLVDPLLEHLEEHLENLPEERRWSLRALRGTKADKQAFRRLFQGDDTPALALVSCHGLALEADNPQQRSLQGALICQKDKEDTLNQYLFHLHDIPRFDQVAASPIHGLVAFCFACYGAGTPLEDDYPQESSGDDPHLFARRLTPEPFVAAWPQALLEEGALAVVGHVDRGWTLSFAWSLGHRYTEAGRSLEDTIRQLIDGHRLGHAMRALHRRYAAIAAHLTRPMDALRRGAKVNRRRLASTWTAHHDARNFVILGDPAVYPGGQPSLASSGFGPDARRTGSAAASGLTLPPDAYLHAVREARRTGDTLEAWLAALVRAHRDPSQQ